MTIEVCFQELMGENACQNDKVADTLSGVRVEKQVQNMKAIEPIAHRNEYYFQMFFQLALKLNLLKKMKRPNIMWGK